MSRYARGYECAGSNRDEQRRRFGLCKNEPNDASTRHDSAGDEQDYPILQLPHQQRRCDAARGKDRPHEQVHEPPIASGKRHRGHGIGQTIADQTELLDEASQSDGQVDRRAPMSGLD